MSIRFRLYITLGLCAMLTACHGGLGVISPTTVTPIYTTLSASTAQFLTETPSSSKVAVVSPSPQMTLQPYSETVSPTSVTVTSSPTVTVTPTTSKIAIPGLTSTLSTKSASIPDIYYFVGASLYKKAVQQQQEPVHLMDFPDLGKVYECMLVQDKIVFLSDKALQLYDLSNHHVTVISQFNQALYLYTFMSYDEVGNQLIYWIIVNDPQSDFTRGTIVGFYDLTNKNTRELPQFHYSLTVLGFDAGHHYLYIHPNGQSFDFGPILEIDPHNGQTVGQIDLEGNVWAALSPDKRLIATEWLSHSPDLTQNWWQLRLYDLTSTPPAPLTISLPNTPSHTTMHFWSEDSQKLYFCLVKGDYGDVGAETGSYGLWSLDISSREMRQVTKIDDYSYTGVDLAWPWILLTYSMNNNSPLLVNLTTGQHAFISLPVTAKIVREGQ